MIVDQSIPIDVPRLLGIGVLVERGAVEAREAVSVVRKMAGHPVEDDAKPGAMTGLDQRCEIGGASETAGRREHAGRLIAPGAVKRMLGDRHELDMGEIEIAHIGRQRVGELAIGQPAMARVGSPPPRAEMNFIDRDRSFARVAAGRRRRRTIDRRRFDDDRCRLWAQLGGKRHRIGFEREELSVGTQNLELVFVAGRDRGRKNLPKAVAAHAHGMAAPVPIVEVADDAHAFSIGRKHREDDTRDAPVDKRVRAELIVELKMRALAQKMEIEIGQHRRETIRVLQLYNRSRRSGRAGDRRRHRPDAGRRTVPPRGCA